MISNGKSFLNFNRVLDTLYECFEKQSERFLYRDKHWNRQTAILLTLTFTYAPILNSFVRIMMHCACENSVEQSPIRLNSLSNT